MFTNRSLMITVRRNMVIVTLNQGRHRGANKYRDINGITGILNPTNTKSVSRRTNQTATEHVGQLPRSNQRHSSVIRFGERLHFADTVSTLVQGIHVDEDGDKVEQKGNGVVTVEPDTPLQRRHPTGRKRRWHGRRHGHDSVRRSPRYSPHRPFCLPRGREAPCFECHVMPGCSFLTPRSTILTGKLTGRCRLFFLRNTRGNPRSDCNRRSRTRCYTSGDRRRLQVDNRLYSRRVKRHRTRRRPRYTGRCTR